MPTVTLNGTLIAQSDNTKVVEGNHYFPPSSVETSLFTKSDTSSICPWKGTASYYNAIVDGKTVEDVAWYYPSALEKAKHIEGYIAFYKNKVTMV